MSGPQTRAALLLSAEDALCHGYEAASLAGIARACGVTTGAVYHAFPDGKPALLAAVAEVRSERLRLRTEAIAAQTSGADRLGVWLEAAVCAWADPGLRTLLRDGAAVLGPSWRASLLRPWRRDLEADAMALCALGRLPSPPEIMIRLWTSGVIEGGALVAESSDPDRTVVEVVAALLATISPARR